MIDKWDIHTKEKGHSLGFVPCISHPVWSFTYVAYSLTSSKPAKTPRDGASDTPRLLIAFSHNYIVNNYI